MNITYALIVLAVAFVVTYLCVPLSKKLAHMFGAVDYPSKRRINHTPIPRCGGIAMYLGLTAAAASVIIGEHCFGWQLDELYVLSGINYYLLYMGVTAMFLVGLIDDVTQLSPKVKFLGQILAACIIAYSGVGINAIRPLGQGDYVQLMYLDGPLTVLVLVVFVNITNLIDGLDGLASGLVAIASCALLYLMMLRGAYTLGFVCLGLLGTTLAFLRFNFFPASVYMGDSGSHLLGTIVGIVAIVGVIRTQTMVTMLVPLLIAGIPILDTSMAVIRRISHHTPISLPDLNHVHHKLLRAGLSQKRSVAVLWTCSAALALTGCLINGVVGPIRWAIIGVVAIVVAFVVWRFGALKPVLRHHYDNFNKRGPRRPHGES